MRCIILLLSPRWTYPTWSSCTSVIFLLVHRILDYGHEEIVNGWSRRSIWSYSMIFSNPYFNWLSNLWCMWRFHWPKNTEGSQNVPDNRTIICNTPINKKYTRKERKQGKKIVLKMNGKEIDHLCIHRQTLLQSCHDGYPNHLLLNSAPNLGPLISRWEINKFRKLIQKCQDFRGSAFVSAIIEFVKFPTRYEWSNIRRPVQ